MEINRGIAPAQINERRDKLMSRQEYINKITKLLASMNIDQIYAILSTHGTYVATRKHVEFASVPGPC